MMNWREEEQLNGKEDVEDRKTEEVEVPKKERVQPAEEQAEPEEKIHEAAAAVEKGDKVSGTVVRITEREVLVDIDSKSEGIIPLSELTIKQVDSTEDVLEEGDNVESEVLSIDDEGMVYLSKRVLYMDRKKQIEDQITIVANTIQEYRIPEKKARIMNAIQGWTEKGFTLSDEDLKEAIEKGREKVKAEEG